MQATAPSGRHKLDPEHPGRYSSSLVAGLAMLVCFTPEHTVRGIAEMAEELDLGRSTTHRYATTLVALGLLERGPQRKYWLSAHASDVGLALLDSMPVRKVARQHLQRLRAKTRHTVCLATLIGRDVVYIDCLRGSRQGQYAIDVGIGPGTRRPVYCTAAGKAILARLPAAERDKLVRSLRLRRVGPKTITTKTALNAELERVLAGFGVAAEDEELIAGRCALGAAVVDGDGRPVAAVELVVPVAHHTEERTADFASVVLGAAERIGVTLLQEQGGDQLSQTATNSLGDV